MSRSGAEPRTELGAILDACGKDLATGDDGERRGDGREQLAKAIGISATSLQAVMRGAPTAPGTLALVACYLEIPLRTVRQWAAVRLLIPGSRRQSVPDTESSVTDPAPEP